jgi:hypothetical protein
MSAINRESQCKGRLIMSVPELDGHLVGTFISMRASIVALDMLTISHNLSYTNDYLKLNPVRCMAPSREDPHPHDDF